MFYLIYTEFLMTAAIFNSAKTIEEYKNTPIFMGPEPGFMDTIYKNHPKLWNLYKELKALDWSEDEFDFTRCLLDFKNCHQDTSDMMIETIGWQWEADSVAGRSVVSILAPFVSSTEYWTTLVRIADNENIHGATYSEIVKLSFEDTDSVMQRILNFKNTQARMTILENTLSEALTLSRKYAAGEIEASDELYRDVPIKTTICLLFLERVQFMASFAVTFSICSTGLFQPIGKAVQKICQDELEVHAEFDKEVIKYELKTERGQWAMESLKPWMHQIADEFIQCEYSFIDSLFRDGRHLPGVTPDMLKQWVLYNAKDVVRFLGLDMADKYTFPKYDPMPLLETWINMNKTQAAPQEQDLAQYKVGVVIDDAAETVFDLDF